MLVICKQHYQVAALFKSASIDLLDMTKQTKKLV